MHQNGIFMTYIVLKLTDGLQKRLAFNISDGSAYLYNSDPVLILFFGTIEPALDLVCDVRNDLYGTSAVVSRDAPSEEQTSKFYRWSRWNFCPGSHQ